VTTTDEEITAVVRSTEPVKWANDSDFSACYKCDEAFTFMLRVRPLLHHVIIIMLSHKLIFVFFFTEAPL
jgi:hypothetical protein